ncbi:ECF transporter S component [Candidatus Bathyarchaeota archaeon]|nr:ECF transporter S component [Candidatus Bathyarchaeota archaeon]
MKSEPAGYRLTTRSLAISAVMAALVCVATMLVQIPNPPTRGYINVGDAMIFVSALTFGMIVGGVAGGIGSALADILSGYAFYAPFTLVIKGMEGLLAGVISDRKRPKRDFLAVIVAGAEMILGYFFVEAYIFGIGAALTEVPGNIFQILVGGLIGIPVAYLVRKRFPIAYRI